MNLDLRLPIGLMFTAFGLLLAGYGVMSNPAIYRRSLDVNVNLWWGLALLGFGLAMLWLALRARRAGEPRARDVGEPPADGP